MKKVLGPNSTPCVFHFPGNRLPTIYSQVLNFIENETFICSEEISILLIANKEYLDRYFLVAQLKNSNISYLTPKSAYNVKSEDWYQPNKIKYIIETLKNCKTKYALILDTRDVLITGNIELEKFKNTLQFYNKKILYNAGNVKFPKVDVENEDYSSDTEYKYLNAGVCFGEVQYLLPFYEKIQTIVKDYPDNFSEQFLVRTVASTLEFKSIVGIDYKCKLFQCAHKNDIYVYYISENILKFKNVNKYLRFPYKIVSGTLPFQDFNLGIYILIKNTKDYFTPIKNILAFIKNKIQYVAFKFYVRIYVEEQLDDHFLQNIKELKDKCKYLQLQLLVFQKNFIKNIYGDLKKLQDENFELLILNKAIDYNISFDKPFSCFLNYLNFAYINTQYYFKCKPIKDLNNYKGPIVEILNGNNCEYYSKYKQCPEFTYSQKILN